MSFLMDFLLLFTLYIKQIARTIIYLQQANPDKSLNTKIIHHCYVSKVELLQLQRKPDLIEIKFKN